VTTDDAQVFHPGRIVPRSGIYRCDGDDDDHAYESTDVAGHRFPPLPRGCRAEDRVLVRAARRHWDAGAARPRVRRGTTG
jgi:hypothetical protein